MHQNKRSDTSAVFAAPASHVAGRWLVGTFSLTLMTSASLLFWLQPMATKFILPSMGGVPQVWNTAMLFFQTSLLLGYIYAHLLSRHLKPRAQAAVHLALLAACLLWLPIGVDVSVPPPTDGDPSLWVIAALLLGVGAPFVVVSGSAPLLQHWFADTGHKDAHNPYFLYAASNIGSMSALFGYPLLAEPLLDLGGQSMAWSLTFIALFGLTGLSAALALRLGGASEEAQDATNGDAASEGATPPTRMHRFMWLALVMASTSLMLGVTTNITIDVAAVPLLWVVPLALFLGTFIIVFARKPIIGAQASFRLLIIALPMFATLWVWRWLGLDWLAWTGALLGIYVVIVLACHAELARIRPHKAWLTEFYLWIALGGMLGGAFNALAAPLLFQNTIEFYVMMAFAITLILAARNLERNRDPGLMLALSCAFIVVPVAADQMDIWTKDGVIERQRDYFGKLTVRDDTELGVRMLSYGTTIHGIQDLSPGKERTPGGYYSVGSSVYQAFEEIAARPASGDIAAIGLGVGAVSCFPTGGRNLTFYEINPSVTRIASDPNLFSFLKGCGKDVRVRHGDGRLNISAAPAAAFDLIFLDAFSSDSIPVHLLTREAVEVYLQKLAPHGMIVMHLTNRHLDLGPVAASIARDLGLAAIHREGKSPLLDNKNAMLNSSTYMVVIAREAEDLVQLASHSGWEVLPTENARRTWTDSYTNILGVLRVLQNSPQDATNDTQ